jgi:hypothetical protein
VFHGLQDKTAPPSHAALYALAIPQAQAHRLPGRDHQPHNDLSAVMILVPSRPISSDVPRMRRRIKRPLIKRHSIRDMDRPIPGEHQSWSRVTETRVENEKVSTPFHGDETDDAARWWRAYQLAEKDQIEELRELAAAGDYHARRQLASWLDDRAYSVSVADPAKLAEAIEVIRPLADAGDDVAELWLARWLAECDRMEELRERAGAGGHHATRQLAQLLADHDLLDELRDRLSDSGDQYALHELARRLIERDMGMELRELLESADADQRQLILDSTQGASSAWPNAVSVLADFGHRPSRRHLARRLAREGRLDELRHRAEQGDEYAQHSLGEALNKLGAC